MIRFAVVCTISWSREEKMITPENFWRPVLSAVIDSISRWSVGSSSMSTFEFSIIIRERSTRTFSPPDNTFIFLAPSSPAKSIRPRNPRT